MSRRLAREAVLKALFAVDLGNHPVHRAVEDVLAEANLPPRDADFARELAIGAVEHKDESDRVISERAVGWTIERMATVDRNILRLAIFELNHRDDIPANIAVNEAVELAKRFGEEDSGKFINGILGEFVRAQAVTDE